MELRTLWEVPGTQVVDTLLSLDEGSRRQQEAWFASWMLREGASSPVPSSGTS